MDIARLSGLDAMRMVVDGRLPPPSIALTLGFELAELELGRAVFACTPDDRALNPMGGVHGGLIATLLDSATGCAVHTTLEPGDSYGTVHLEVKMIRGAPQGVRLLAEGRVLSTTKRVGFAEATLKDEAGTLYAHGSATCSIRRAGG